MLKHVLRFEAIVHNTTQLRCGRVLDRFGEIVDRLAGMVNRFTTTLDCLDIGFLPEDTFDQLPLPSQIGATRGGGLDPKQTTDPRSVQAWRAGCATDHVRRQVSALVA